MDKCHFLHLISIDPEFFRFFVLQISFCLLVCVSSGEALVHIFILVIGFLLVIRIPSLEIVLVLR